MPPVESGGIFYSTIFSSFFLWDIIYCTKARRTLATVNNQNSIILVGPAHPLRGGIADFNESFALSLIEAGIPTKIVGFYLQYPNILFPGKSQETSSPKPDIEIDNLISSINPISWYKTAKHIASQKPQLVVVRFWIPFMGPALGTIARHLRKKGIKVIGMVDNAIPHEARPFDKQLSTYFFKQCNAFFTLSKSVSHDLEKLVPGRPSATSPHPIYDTFGQAVSREESLTKLKLDPSKKYVLFFGFVRKYKGLDLLIEAMGSVKVKKLGVKLIVAGEFYDSKTDYLEQIEKLGLDDTVIIRDDFIPQDEVKYYFCGANLVAQTYRTATQSGVTQIAYHFDKPMLVTDVGGLSEIVPNGEVGFVVAPKPKAIADAIVRYFDEDREALFTENTHNRKKLFSWKHFTQTFLNFVKQIDAKS